MKKMIRAIFTGSVFFLSVSLSAFCIYGEEEAVRNIIAMSLKDAIEIANMNNKSVQIQERELDYARGNILDARSRFLPQVNTGYSYTYNDAVVTTLSGRGQRKDPGIFSGYKNDNLFDVSLEESVYNGGANIANLEQAKLGLKIQEETLRATRLEVEFETKRLFYGLLLAYETKRIAEDLVGQARAHYEETKAKFNQGTASKFDVLQSKVQVSRLVPQLVNADNAIDLIMAEFKKELSLSMKDPVDIEGKLDYSIVEIKEDEFLHEAYARNPEMVLRLLGVTLNKWAIEFAKAGWLPQISANAAYSYRSNSLNNMFNPRHDNWNIGVKASIALFDGFATKAKVDEAKARYQQANLQKEDIIDQIAVDVTTACLNLKESKAIIDAEKDSVDEAKEALRLSEVRYNNGVGINLDVLDSQVALAQVEQTLAQGIYDYLMAKGQLLFAGCFKRALFNRGPVAGYIDIYHCEVATYGKPAGESDYAYTYHTSVRIYLSDLQYAAIYPDHHLLCSRALLHRHIEGIIPERQRDRVNVG